MDTENLKQTGKNQADNQMMKSLKSIPLQQLIKIRGMKIDPAALIRINRELNHIRK